MVLKPTYASIGVILGSIAGLVLIAITIGASLSTESFTKARVPSSITQLLGTVSGGDTVVTTIGDVLEPATYNSLYVSPQMKEMYCQFAQEGSMTTPIYCVNDYEPPIQVSSS
jgi:hypothetical protein